jgi:putative ABC transport system permease protein
MGLKDALRNNENEKAPVVKKQNFVPRKSASIPVIHKKQKKYYHRNLKQIFILSFDALRERKARSALTILMVVVGSALMVALNGLSAGAADFISKQLSFLAPNVIFVSPGQIGFRGGPSAPPTIVFNGEVVNRIKSLPFVQDVVPAYQGQLQLDAQGSIINSQVLSTDPTKIYLIAPSMQLVPGSSIQANNPIGMLVGDGVANPPGKTTPFVTVGQTVKATSTFVNPNTGRTQQTSRSFVVTGVLQPTGNGQVDKVVFINTATGNSLFKKSGQYDEMVTFWYLC